MLSLHFLVSINHVKTSLITAYSSQKLAEDLIREFEYAKLNLVIPAGLRRWLSCSVEQTKLIAMTGFVWGFNVVY